jgi:pimeloyl-ACP methyl ester carboxylesterase
MPEIHFPYGTPRRIFLPGKHAVRVVDSVKRMDLEVSGVRLSAQSAGSGKPVLFLHGAGGALAWLPYYDALAGAYALTLPDHPGFGHSENPDWIRTVDDIAMLYLDLLEERDLRGVHLIGHSLGGWIAAELATRDRSRLASLTLIDPAGLRVKGVPIADNFIWTPEETAHALYYDRAFAERALAWVPTDEEADIVVANRFSAAKLAWQPRWYNPNLPKWLHRVRVPTHVIWGAHDNLFPAAYADAWCEKLPAARRLIVEKAGHSPHVEQCASVAAASLAFLREHDA